MEQVEDPMVVHSETGVALQTGLEMGGLDDCKDSCSQ
jgi:hypothetical protein